MKNLRHDDLNDLKISVHGMVTREPENFYYIYHIPSGINKDEKMVPVSLMMDLYVYIHYLHQYGKNKIIVSEFARLFKYSRKYLHSSLEKDNYPHLSGIPEKERKKVIFHAIIALAEKSLTFEDKRDTPGRVQFSTPIDTMDFDFKCKKGMQFINVVWNASFFFRLKSFYNRVDLIKFVEIGKTAGRRNRHLQAMYLRLCWKLSDKTKGQKIANIDKKENFDYWCKLAGINPQGKEAKAKDEFVKAKELRAKLKYLMKFSGLNFRFEVKMKDGLWAENGYNIVFKKKFPKSGKFLQKVEQEEAV